MTDDGSLGMSAFRRAFWSFVFALRIRGNRIDERDARKGRRSEVAKS